MAYFRPWESSIVDNSQATQQRNDTDSVQTNQNWNSADALQTDLHGFSNDALFDNHVSTKHLQIVTRLTNLLQSERSVAHQLHRYYIESLTQLQSSSSYTSSQQPSEHQQGIQQSSKQRYEDLFFIINRQCEVLEEHMHGCTRNKITGPPCRATGGSSCDGVLDLALLRKGQSRGKGPHAQNISSLWCNSTNNRLLNKYAIKVLNCWYVSNQRHPYLTAVDALHSWNVELVRSNK